MADTEKDVNRAAAAPQEEASAAQAAPEAPQPETQDAEKTEKREKHAEGDAPTADESYKKGVTMTLDKCREAFGKMGVSEIEAQGKPFDPELHAAVLQQPSTDDMPSGTVTQVMQKGYLLHDKVIRHAAVAVAE